jgi:hypothetical protein
VVCGRRVNAEHEERHLAIRQARLDAGEPDPAQVAALVQAIAIGGLLARLMKAPEREADDAQA